MFLFILWDFLIRCSAARGTGSAFQCTFQFWPGEDSFLDQHCYNNMLELSHGVHLSVCLLHLLEDILEDYRT